jgi:hypothetical protein
MRFHVPAFVAALSFVAPVFAAPGVESVKRTDQVFSTIHGTVAELQTSVEKDLKSIGNPTPIMHVEHKLTGV